MGKLGRGASGAYAAVLAVLLLPATGCAGAGTAAGPHPGREELVQTGYGEMERSRLAGAVSSVSVADEGAMHEHTLAEFLRSRVPGLQVLGDLSHPVLRLRGVSTFMGSTEPLVVVDGVAISEPGFGNGLWAINPRDVLRVDVLKDGASAALYGVRGGNGVIVITTRRGR